MFYVDVPEGKKIHKSPGISYFTCMHPKTAAKELPLECRSKKLSEKFSYAVNRTGFIKLGTHQSRARLRSSTTAACPAQTTAGLGMGRSSFRVSIFCVFGKHI